MFPGRRSPKSKDGKESYSQMTNALQQLESETIRNFQNLSNMQAENERKILMDSNKQVEIVHLRGRIKTIENELKVERERNANLTEQIQTMKAEYESKIATLKKDVEDCRKQVQLSENKINKVIGDCRSLKNETVNLNSSVLRETNKNRTLLNTLNDRLQKEEQQTFRSREINLLKDWRKNQNELLTLLRKCNTTFDGKLKLLSERESEQKTFECICKELQTTLREKQCTRSSAVEEANNVVECFKKESSKIEEHIKSYKQSLIERNEELKGVRNELQTFETSFRDLEKTKTDRVNDLGCCWKQLTELSEIIESMNKHKGMLEGLSNKLAQITFDFESCRNCLNETTEGIKEIRKKSSTNQQRIYDLQNASRLENEKHTKLNEELESLNEKHKMEFDSKQELIKNCQGKLAEWDEKTVENALEFKNVVVDEERLKNNLQKLYEESDKMKRSYAEQKEALQNDIIKTRSNLIKINEELNNVTMENTTMEASVFKMQHEARMRNFLKVFEQTEKLESDIQNVVVEITGKCGECCLITTNVGTIKEKLNELNKKLGYLNNKLKGELQNENRLTEALEEEMSECSGILTNVKDEIDKMINCYSEEDKAFNNKIRETTEGITKVEEDIKKIEEEIEVIQKDKQIRGNKEEEISKTMESDEVSCQVLTEERLKLKDKYVQLHNVPKQRIALLDQNIGSTVKDLKGKENELKAVTEEIERVKQELNEETRNVKVQIGMIKSDDCDIQANNFRKKGNSIKQLFTEYLEEEEKSIELFVKKVNDYKSLLTQLTEWSSECGNYEEFNRILKEKIQELSFVGENDETKSEGLTDGHRETYHDILDKILTRCEQLSFVRDVNQTCSGGISDGTVFLKRDSTNQNYLLSDILGLLDE